MQRLVYLYQRATLHKGVTKINNRRKHFIQKNPLTRATDVAGETFTLWLGCDGLVLKQDLSLIQSHKLVPGVSEKSMV